MCMEHYVDYTATLGSVGGKGGVGVAIGGKPKGGVGHSRGCHGWVWLRLLNC